MVSTRTQVPSRLPSLTRVSRPGCPSYSCRSHRSVQRTIAIPGSWSGLTQRTRLRRRCGARGRVPVVSPARHARPAHCVHKQTEPRVSSLRGVSNRIRVCKNPAYHCQSHHCDLCCAGLCWTLYPSPALVWSSTHLKSLCLFCPAQRSTYAVTQLRRIAGCIVARERLTRDAR